MTQVMQDLHAQIAPMIHRKGKSDTPLKDKVRILCNFYEFGKAMNIVRKGETFRAIDFEPEDQALFPDDKMVLDTIYDEEYGQAIIPDDFTPEEVKSAIKCLSVSSAPGYSGISFSHLKLLKEKGAFATNFAAFANKLIKNSDLVHKL